MIVTITISNKKETYPWTYDTVLKGYVAVKFKDKTDCSNVTAFKTKPVAPQGSGKHHLWCFEVSDVFNQINGLRDRTDIFPTAPPLFDVDTDAKTVTFTASGILTAQGGTTSDAQFKQIPLAKSSSPASVPA